MLAEPEPVNHLFDAQQKETKGSWGFELLFNIHHAYV